jgi:hypothetical protein
MIGLMLLGRVGLACCWRVRASGLVESPQGPNHVTVVVKPEDRINKEGKVMREFVQSTRRRVAVVDMVVGAGRRFGSLSGGAALLVARRKTPLRLFVATTALVSAIALSGSSAAGATDPVPEQLAGQWAILHPLPEGGTEYLLLAGSHFTFFHNSPAKHAKPAGQVSVSGDTITFYSSNECTGTGTYIWSLSDGGLTFVQVPTSSDPCPREALLTLGTWTRR